MFIRTLIIFFSISSVVISQTDIKQSEAGKTDTTKLWITINPVMNRMNFERNNNTPFEINPAIFAEVLRNDSASAWLKTKMLLNYPVFGMKKDFISASEMTLPLYHKLMEDNKMSLFYSILGSIQTAAVGVLAYQHIKKYGFLKRKDD